MNFDQTVSEGLSDVEYISRDGRLIVLVGTAHISQQSVDLVREIISREKPDYVCVELDERRYRSLAERSSFVTLDVREIVRKKQLSTLMVNLILAAYQKKLGGQLGVLPGAEMLAAIEAAGAADIPVSLCDRDVRVTLRRAWHSTSLWKKGHLLAALIAGLFDQQEISEEKLAELRRQDVLSELLREMGEALPEIKKVLIDERDLFLAEKIRQTPGRHVVAVVGAGHVAGISARLKSGKVESLDDISSIPPVSGYWKVIGWGVPAAIVTALVFIGWSKGADVAGANLRFWILANGIPAALGALIALAHPLTVVGAFFAAPVTSLTPVIGAGYVTAFIQVMMQPPQVMEFESALADMATVRGWWRNKLLKVFLAFFLPGFGSMLGTWIGGYEIFSNMF